MGKLDLENLQSIIEHLEVSRTNTENIIEEEQGIVLDVLQKGYMYKDKLLRPAMVKVNE